MELIGPPSTEDLLSMGLQDSGLFLTVGAMEGRISGRGVVSFEFSKKKKNIQFPQNVESYWPGLMKQFC